MGVVTYRAHVRARTSSSTIPNLQQSRSGSGKRMLPALMSDLCYSVCPSRNSSSRQKPTSCHETQPQRSLSRNSRRVEHLSRNSRGAEHLSRNSRVTKLKGGPKESGVSPGPQTTPDTPALRARAWCALVLARKKSIPSIRALAFSFFSDINRHHFSSASELEAEGEPCR